MKIGDLVTVHPAACSVYILVGEKAGGECVTMGKLWLLYNKRIGIQPMYEKWIEVISESSKQEV
tara:strand:- start:373 stop:564 length:192 start_codon:yes stop_codon:yes gene_type:complete